MDNDLESEIQNLEEELQKKIDRNAQLSTTFQISRIEIELIVSFTVATLFDEVDILRNHVCHSCKQKLLVVLTNVLHLQVPQIVLVLLTLHLLLLFLESLWRRIFQGHQPFNYFANPLCTEISTSGSTEL